MKKNFIKVFVVASVIIALIFVCISVITAYGGLTSEDYDNGLVKGLFTALAIAFVVLSAVSVIMLFAKSEYSREVVLNSSASGSTRTTAGVIDSVCRKTIKPLQGISFKKSNVLDNEFGVRLIVVVSLKDISVKEAETTVRNILNAAFKEYFDFTFYSIEIRVKKYKNAIPPMNLSASSFTSPVEERQENETEVPTPETVGNEEETAPETQADVQEEIQAETNPVETEPTAEPIEAENTAESEPVAEIAEDDVTEIDVPPTDAN
jgi:hypothetical protein